MTILHVITRLILGGAQENTVYSCRAQVQEGHRVWLAYGPIHGPEGSLLDQAMNSGAELVEVASMRRAILPLHDLCCYLALRRLIRRIQPDVVHTHSSKAGILGRVAAWHERVPAVIHTVHGLAFHGRQRSVVSKTYIQVERWAARHCHKMIAVAAAMVDSFTANRIGQSDQFTVIRSGIDIGGCASQENTRADVRAELGIPLDAPVVVIVARLDALKGQEDLIEIFPSILQDHPEARLLLVGDGTYRKALEQQIKGAGVSHRVLLVGLVSPSRVREMLAAADVKALPSYQEGSPRVLAQALACGCGIVGYDVGGIGEICIDGETGRLVALGDRGGLEQAIRWMLVHREQRQAMVARGQRLVHQNFDVHEMVRRINAVYAEVMGASQVQQANERT